MHTYVYTDIHKHMYMRIKVWHGTDFKNCGAYVAFACGFIGESNIWQIKLVENHNFNLAKNCYCLLTFNSFKTALFKFDGLIKICQNADYKSLSNKS